MTSQCASHPAVSTGERPQRNGTVPQLKDSPRGPRWVLELRESAIGPRPSDFLGYDFFLILSNFPYLADLLVSGHFWTLASSSLRQETTDAGAACAGAAMCKRPRSARAVPCEPSHSKSRQLGLLLTLHEPDHLHSLCSCAAE